MKKNKMMRLAAVLMVAVLMTTCAISGTFAKYISTASGEDSARVAYWGFGLDSSIEINDLFLDAYINVNSTTEADGTKDDVIAPGTSNFKTFKFAYTNNENEDATAPEVKYNFKVDVSESTIATDIENNPNIQWDLVAVDGAAAEIPEEDSDEWGNWDTLIADLKALSGDASGSMDYAPNTAPAAFAEGTEWIIAWQWIFTDAADTDGDGISDQDEMDTAMGNKQILDEVSIKIEITATQID